MPGVRPEPDRRAAVIRRLAELVVAIERPHPVRIGVDGFSAAGKSTLADELATTVAERGRTCLRAGLDDFKRPRAERPAGPTGFYQGAWDLDAIRTFLLVPSGPAGAGGSG